MSAVFSLARLSPLQAVIITRDVDIFHRLQQLASHSTCEVADDKGRGYMAKRAHKLFSPVCVLSG